MVTGWYKLPESAIASDSADSDVATDSNAEADPRHRWRSHQQPFPPTVPPAISITMPRASVLLAG